MHHKFAVIDNSAIITGGFNWSSQAVNHNQENILFLENKNIAQQYTDEFNLLCNEYKTFVDKEKAIKYLEEKERIRKEKLESKLKKERDKKLNEKEKDKFENQKEILKQKEMEKIQKQKDRETQKLEKQKEKAIFVKEKFVKEKKQ